MATVGAAEDRFIAERKSRNDGIAFSAKVLALAEGPENDAGEDRDRRQQQDQDGEVEGLLLLRVHGSG